MTELTPRERVAQCASELGLSTAGIAPHHLLPLLHRLQVACDGLDAEHLRALADAVNLGRAEVFGVATAYADLRVGTDRPPPPPRHIELCGGDACHARGAGPLVHAISQRSDVRVVYCLGHCACGPCARVDGRLVLGLDDAGLQRLGNVAPA